MARARETVRQGMGVVSPRLMVLRLTGGVFAAMALVVLLCGVTTVSLGRALAAKDTASVPASASP